MLVMIRLVAPEGNEPDPGTWELVAAACGLPGHAALLAEHDAARQSIAALWNSIKERANDQ
jgi:glutamate-ammonia-ligase adenylyltransferase